MFGLFLVVCPLSVLHNWVDEHAKFAPKSVFSNPPLQKVITNNIQDSRLYVSWYSNWKSGAQTNCDVASWSKTKDDCQSKSEQKDYEGYEIDRNSNKEIPKTEEQG